MTGEVVLKVGYMATYLDQDIHVDLHRCPGWQVAADLFAIVTEVLRVQDY
jgi:predicted ArsR family transcriptional regulator